MRAPARCIRPARTEHPHLVFTVSGSALPAQPADGQLDCRRLKPVAFGEVGPHLLHQVASMMLDAVTRNADEVKLIVRVGQLPAGGSIGAELGLTDQAQLGEQGKRAVNRRQVDPVTNLVRHVLRSQMAVAGFEHLPYPAARLGESMSVTAQVGGEVDRFCHGDSVAVRFA